MSNLNEDVIEVGQIRVNKKGYQFKVLEKDKRRWNIIFLKTNFETSAESKEIRLGKVKDWLAPSVCDVGIVGINIIKPQSHYLYDRWRDILRRCYDENCRAYSTYGKRGCRVSDSWKYFDNFVRDIENKENFELLKDKINKYEIDKDCLVKDNKIYSNETTVIISKKDNLQEMFNRNGFVGDKNKRKVMQFTTGGDYVNTYNSMIEAVKEVSCNTRTNITSIWSCCNKSKMKTYLNYCWIYESSFENFEKTKLEILKYLG